MSGVDVVEGSGGSVHIFSLSEIEIKMINQKSEGGSMGNPRRKKL